MKSRGNHLKALVSSTVIMLLLALAIPGVCGSQTGGSGYDRWALLVHTGNATANFTVPERVYNDYNYSYSGTFTLPTGSGTYYVNFTISGGASTVTLPSGALTANGTVYVNSTSAYQIPNSSTHLNATLMNSTYDMQDYINLSITVSTRSSYVLNQMTSMVMEIVMIFLIVTVVFGIVGSLTKSLDLGQKRRRR